jgi:hypothetical protein
LRRWFTLEAANWLPYDPEGEMTMKKHLAIAASVIALSAAPALADNHDADHEFPLSMAEFMAAYPDVTPEEFAEIDTDGDGQISEEEYDDAREAGLVGDGDDEDDEG